MQKGEERLKLFKAEEQEISSRLLPTSKFTGWS